MNKLKILLYLSAVLLIVIPILIVFISDIPFSSTFSNTVISTSIVLVILGILITVFQKSKENKIIVGEIGAIIGLSIVLIISLIQ